MRSAVLELRGVSTRTDDRPLSGIDLVVGDGDAVVVIGLPGAGKTSLVRLIAGLDEVVSGHMHLFGHAVETLSFALERALRDRVGVVFERGGLWANRSVLENLVLPVAYRDNRSLKSLAGDPWLREVLEGVGLGAIGERATASLDDSETRRVLYARALYTKPDLLLIDEPQASLSRAHTRAIAAFLELERKRRGMTILYTDADGRLDPFEADRPVVIHNRRIVPGAVRLPERGAHEALAEGAP